MTFRLVSLIAILLLSGCKFIPWQGEKRSIPLNFEVASDSANFKGDLLKSLIPEYQYFALGDYNAKETQAIVIRIHVGSPDGPTITSLESVESDQVLRTIDTLTIKDMEVPVGQLYAYFFAFNTIAGTGFCHPGLQADPSCANINNASTVNNEITSIWTIGGTLPEQATFIGDIVPSSGQTINIVLAEMGAPFVAPTTDLVNVKFCYQDDGTDTISLTSGSHIKVVPDGTSCDATISYGPGTKTWGIDAGQSGTQNRTLLSIGGAAWPVALETGNSTGTFQWKKPLLGGPPIMYKFIDNPGNPLDLVTGSISATKPWGCTGVEDDEFDILIPSAQSGTPYWDSTQAIHIYIQFNGEHPDGCG